MNMSQGHPTHHQEGQLLCSVEALVIAMAVLLHMGSGTPMLLATARLVLLTGMLGLIHA